jgi:hypothetical protein
MYFLLIADADTLMKRAESTERKRKIAMNTRAEIEQWLAKSPFHSIPQGHLCNSINTTRISALDVAEKIIKSYKIIK